MSVASWGSSVVDLRQYNQEWMNTSTVEEKYAQALSKGHTHHSVFFDAV